MNRITALLSLKPILFGLIGMILSGLSFPLVGVIVVRHNLISMRYMLMHSVILGGILSIALNLPLLCTVIPLNLLFVLLINYMKQKGYAMSNASSIMMVFTIGLASLLSHVFKVPAKDTLEVLWGSPFALTKTDLFIIAVLAMAVFIYTVLCFRQISAVFFDEDVAFSYGINVKFHSFLMILCTSLVISVAMKELGALLIDALLILPVVSVSKDTDSLKQVFVKSSVTGLVLSVFGYFASLVFNVPVSGVLALFAALWLWAKNTKIGKTVVLIIGLLLVSFSLHASPVKENNLPEKNSFVASTSWVASICQIAGIDDMKIIAPSDMKHPPEYEITPNDIYVISNAKLFMHAGYEIMMDTIRKAGEVDSEKVIKVKTTNTLENITDMVKKISEKAGTQDEAEKRLARFTEVFEQCKNRIMASDLKDMEVFVNINNEETVRNLGLKIAGTFGPGPMDSEQLSLAAREKFIVVIDNYHNPVAAPISKVSPQSKVVEWKNFPETMKNDALGNLIEENVSKLLNTLE